MSASSASKPPGGGQRRRAPLVARRPPERDGTGGLGGTRPAPPRRPPGLEDEDGAWMSQQRAAQLAGVSTAVVRGWRKAGTIAERRAPGSGRVEVFLTPDRHHHEEAAEATAEPPSSELGVLVPLEIHQRSLAELILRLTDTTERAVRAEAEVEVLRERLAALERSS